MATIKESLEIDYPVDKLFDYTTTAKNWPIWQSIIITAEPTSSEPMQIGSTYKGIVQIMGLRMKWTAQVTGYEPGIKWAKNITSGGMLITEQVTYEAAGESTKFTIQYDIKPSWFMKLFAPMMASTLRKETIKSLAHLKNVLEA